MAKRKFKHVITGKSIREWRPVQAARNENPPDSFGNPNPHAQRAYEAGKKPHSWEAALHHPTASIEHISHKTGWMKVRIGSRCYSYRAPMWLVKWTKLCMWGGKTKMLNDVRQALFALEDQS